MSSAASDSSANNYRGPIVNWGGALDQVKKDYERPPARGIPHGLQKDAIQNGWGARISNRGWSYEFRIVKCSNGELLLTMTDCNSHGLTGKVYTFEEIKQMGTDDLPSTERLARFEAVFESGGNEGPGLYGRGKLLFNIASKRSTIFYDSLTNDGTYRLGKRYIRGRVYDQLPAILEGGRATSALGEWTHGALRPLESPGTRITIVEPLEETVQSIEDGTFLKAIDETWWEIIRKYDAEITVIREGGEASRAKVPEEYGGPPAGDESGFKTHLKDNLEVDIGSGSLNVKHLHLFLAPHDLEERLQGVSIYRRGMKVGTVDLFNVPEKVASRFFGYVELTEPSEDLLAAAEDLCHYGFNSRHTVYRNLRNEIQSQADAFFEKLGFGRRLGDPNERDKRSLQEAAAHLNQILNEMEVPGLGTGESTKRGIQLSIRGLKFPGGSKNMEAGAEISGFWYVLKNTYAKKKSVRLEVFTSERDSGVLEELTKNQKPISITLEPDQTKETDRFEFVVKSPKYPRNKKISCTAKVTLEGKIAAQKTFFFYFDAEPEKPSQDKVTVTLESADWPNKDTYRVDYDQSVKNLSYQIENHTSIHVRARVRVYTVFVEEKRSIEPYYEGDIDLDSEEGKQVDVGEVKITKEKYAQIEKGKMLLRCGVTALDSTEQWEKGTRLGENNVTFWLNTSPSYGFFDSEGVFEGGAERPRSEVKRTESNRGWVFNLNVTHPAYKAIPQDDQERKEDYNFEEMARRVITVLLSKNNAPSISTIKKLAGLASSDKIEEMAPEDLLERIAYPIVDKILALYHKQR